MVKLLEFFLASEEDNIGPFWWEPNTPGILDIGDVSVFLGALIAFATVFTMVSRWFIKSLRKIINEEITVATQPIHPNANGGLSLADVARRAEKLDQRMENIEAILQRAVELSEEERAEIEELARKKASRGRSGGTRGTRSSKAKNE